MNMSSVSSDRKPLSTSSAKDDRRGQYADDENQERGNWTGRLDFVLSLVGSVCQRSRSKLEVGHKILRL